MIGIWLVGALAIAAVILAIRAYGAHAIGEDHRLFVETAKAHGVKGADTAQAIFLVLPADEAAKQRQPTRWLRLAGNAASVFVGGILAALTVFTVIWLWSQRQHTGQGLLPPAA